MYPWRAARVGIRGAIGPYDGEVRTDDDHDGTPVPRFDLPTVERMAADFTAAGVHWPHRLHLADGIAVVTTLPDAHSEATPADLYEADEEGRYWIGAYIWPWEERPYYGPTRRISSAAQALTARASRITGDDRRAEAYAVLADWLTDLRVRMGDPQLPYIPPLEMRLAHALAELYDA